MMSEVIKNWLPITKRNRVALGFAFAALVLFLTWNLLSYNSRGEGWVAGMAAMKIWPQVFSPSSYVVVVGFLGYYDGFKIVAMMVSLILSGLTVLVILPFWKILHASTYVRLCLAIMNLGGACATLLFAMESIKWSISYQPGMIFVLMALSMLALSASLFIFKNELGLRHELEVKKTMEYGDSQ
jgi:hypothetical protein